MTTVVWNKLKEKYGVGEIDRESCKKCGFEMDLSTAGTHKSDSGCVKVYAEADDFVCPMCSLDSKSDQAAL